MNIIIDYGLGNIRSVTNWISSIGLEVKLSDDPEEIKKADLLILPGVGAYADAMNRLESKELVQVIKWHVNQRKPLIGICLGMQLLFESSVEGGYHNGLSILNGKIVPFSNRLKVPHMGWNTLNGIRPFEQADVYFVHSFYMTGNEEIVLAAADYGVSVPGVVRRKNVLGFQFHPEKSGEMARIIGEYVKEFCDEYIHSN